MKILDQVAAVVLAGGKGSRFGGRDKGLIEFKGKALAQWVYERLQNEGVKRILVSANRNILAYCTMFAEVVCDREIGYPGPLAGIAAAMRCLQHGYVIAAPCDTPFFPYDYVRRLSRAFVLNSALPCAAACVQGKPQPVFCMVRCDLLPNLERFLSRGKGKVRLWLEENHVQWIDFPSIENFENINTQADLEKAVK